MRPGEYAEIGRKETDSSDRHCRSEMPPNDLCIDLGAGKKGQQDRPEPGEVVDPGCQGEVDEIAGDRADDDLEQSHRDRDPGLQRSGDQRKPDPQRRGEPNIVHPKPHLRRQQRCSQTGRQEGKIKPAGQRVADTPPPRTYAAGVISPCGRLRGTPSPPRRNLAPTRRRSTVSSRDLAGVTHDAE